MKKICVFMAGTTPRDVYVEPALEFSRLLGDRGYDLVWGASDIGLMKLVAEKVREHGGKLHGVTIERFARYSQPDCDTLVITKEIPQRKEIMEEMSDAFVALVGGIGTLDEVMQLTELKKGRVHNKPIVVLNTDNFFEGLKTQLERVNSEGLVSAELSDLVFFADTPEEVFEYLERNWQK